MKEIKAFDKWWKVESADYRYNSHDLMVAKCAAWEGWQARTRRAK